MLLAALVVEQRALLGRALDQLGIDTVPSRFEERRRGLEQAQRAACVAAGGAGDGFERVVVGLEMALAEAAFGVGERAAEQLTRSASASASRRNTLQRESTAALTANDGFSVVAPISVTVPFSTCGRKASCWLLLKRWISSTNRIVRLPW